MPSPHHPAPHRLLHVTREAAGDRRYGLGRSLKPLIEGLEARGHQVLYLTQEDLGLRARSWMAQAYRVLESGFRRSRGVTQWAALGAGLLERFNMGRLAFKVSSLEKVTHVHLHDPFLAFGFQCFLRWSWASIPHGITMHGYGSYTQAIHEDGARLGTFVQKRLRALELSILMRCNWVVFPTDAALRQTLRDLGCAPCPSHWRVIPHAGRQLSFPERSVARAQLGWPEDRLYLLAVGRLVPVKHFELAIEALARSRLDSAYLVILGDGDPSPYQLLAERLGVGNRLLFDAVEDPSAYYAAADLYLSASRSESFGLANLEALSAGLPVVATAVGGVPEVLGSAAYYVPDGDAEALANALKVFSASPDLRMSFRQRALQRSAGWPRVADMVSAYEILYRSVRS